MACNTFDLLILVLIFLDVVHLLGFWFSGTVVETAMRMKMSVKALLISGPVTLVPDYDPPLDVFDENPTGALICFGNTVDIISKNSVILEKKVLCIFHFYCSRLALEISILTLGRQWNFF